MVHLSAARHGDREFTSGQPYGGPACGHLRVVDHSGFWPAGCLVGVLAKLVVQGRAGFVGGGSIEGHRGPEATSKRNESFRFEKRIKL